ncbi:uncharacterized protein JN550_007637 [Neoarthrinium moseri]|uniref:uncharacterized protein n=1 Tax=Neoarthrinium moseri TaxID=1658444 RepID=UPI001FDD3E9A|nr:uncharacterized protein JN550_007637 [Neoarthrinium moseri]KAI1866249.1 hypothetical protein JN550_007637 [Neoarthrinium moseri]
MAFSTASIAYPSGPAPWEISVFEPADFFQYGVAPGLGDLASANPSAPADNWLAGTGGDGGFGIDLAGIEWAAGARALPDTNFGFTDVMQNDVFGKPRRHVELGNRLLIGPPPADQLLASTLPSTTSGLTVTVPSSSYTPMYHSSASSLSPDLSPEPAFAPVSTESQGQRTSRKRSPPADPETALKRQRNNIAARKYRQKKIDRISELEDELKGVKDERDDLRVKLARQEAETAALRSLLKIKAGIEL